MKKLLLIYPRFNEKRRTIFPSIPMSLIFVGSYLKYKGYDVKIIDINFIDEPENLIKEEIKDASIVGFSVMSSQVPDAILLSKLIKKTNSNIKIIWGGIHPTLYPEQTAKSEWVDFVVSGEGEKTAYELIEAIEKGKDINSIKGISFKDNDQVKIMPAREPLDMNELPPLDWNLVEGTSEFNKLKEARDCVSYAFQLYTTRGCPFRCAFCINKVLKTGYRMRNLDLVFDDIKRLLDIGVRAISFMDENFFLYKERVLKFLDGIENRGLKFKWFANVRADCFREDYITEELAKRLKSDGCEMVGIGAESGSQKVLDYLCKDIKVEQIKNACNTMINAGIRVNLSFIVGLPNVETINDIIMTLDLLNYISSIDKEMIVSAGIMIYRPYPGSVLYDECVKKGMKVPNDVEDWINSPLLNSSGFKTYTWIQSDVKEKLGNLVFYGNLFCRQSSSLIHSKMIRKWMRTRYKALRVRFPLEIWIYNIWNGKLRE